MSDLPGNEAPSTNPTQPHRSTSGVLAMLGLIIGIPVLVLVVVLVVRSSNGGGTGGQLADQVRESRIQAVYLTDGQVVFGDVRSGEGDWITLSDGYLLRRGATEDANDKDAADQPQLQVVPLSSNVGSDGDRLINANEVLSVENLDTDSPIAEQIRQQRKG